MFRVLLVVFALKVPAWFATMPEVDFVQLRLILSEGTDTIPASAEQADGRLTRGGTPSAHGPRLRERNHMPFARVRFIAARSLSQVEIGGRAESLRQIALSSCAPAVKEISMPT